MKKGLLILAVLVIAACNSKSTPKSCETSAMSSDGASSSASGVTRTASPSISFPRSTALGNYSANWPVSEVNPITLPIWGDDLTRYEGNPVIVGSDLSAKHSFVADPYLLGVGDRLYMFFEAFLSDADESRFDEGLGEIWMAESSDGFEWSNFRQVSIERIHFSHPEALIYNGKVHVFYNHNMDGSIYYRSSPMDGFPNWSEESVIFRGLNHGWHHLVDFTILERQGIWYLLGITGNAPPWGWRRRLQYYLHLPFPWLQDQWVRGRWAGRFPADWGEESTEIEPYPLLDVADFDWLNGIVEITSMELGDRLWLSMGVCQNDEKGTRSIGTYAVTGLTPNAFEGVWLTDGVTFPLASSGWDDTDIHRSHAVAFKGNWVYVYDGRKSAEWKIGIATRPLL